MVKGGVYLLVTASVGGIFRRHDGDEVNQLLKLFMREARSKQIPIRIQCLTIIIFKPRTK